MRPHNPVPLRIGIPGKPSAHLPEPTAEARWRGELRQRIEDIADDRALAEAIEWFEPPPAPAPAPRPPRPVQPQPINPNLRPWTTREDAIVRAAMWPHRCVKPGTWPRIAKELNRSIGAVKRRAVDLRAREPF